MSDGSLGRVGIRHDDVMVDDKASKSMNPEALLAPKPLDYFKNATLPRHFSPFIVHEATGSDDGTSHTKTSPQQRNMDDKGQKDIFTTPPKANNTASLGTISSVPTSSTPVRNRRGSFFASPRAGSMVSPRNHRNSLLLAPQLPVSRTSRSPRAARTPRAHVPTSPRASMISPRTSLISPHRTMLSPRGLASPRTAVGFFRQTTTNPTLQARSLAQPAPEGAPPPIRVVGLSSPLHIALNHTLPPEQVFVPSKQIFNPFAPPVPLPAKPQVSPKRPGDSPSPHRGAPNAPSNARSDQPDVPLHRRGTLTAAPPSPSSAPSTHASPLAHTAHTTHAAALPTRPRPSPRAAPAPRTMLRSPRAPAPAGPLAYLSPRRARRHTPHASSPRASRLSHSGSSAAESVDAAASVDGLPFVHSPPARPLAARSFLAQTLPAALPSRGTPAHVQHTPFFPAQHTHALPRPQAHPHLHPHAHMHAYSAADSAALSVSLDDPPARMPPHPLTVAVSTAVSTTSASASAAPALPGVLSALSPRFPHTPHTALANPIPAQALSVSLPSSPVDSPPGHRPQAALRVPQSTTALLTAVDAARLRHRPLHTATHTATHSATYSLDAPARWSDAYGGSLDAGSPTLYSPLPDAHALRHSYAAHTLTAPPPQAVPHALSLPASAPMGQTGLYAHPYHHNHQPHMPLTTQSQDVQPYHTPPLPQPHQSLSAQSFSSVGGLSVAAPAPAPYSAQYPSPHAGIGPEAHAYDQHLNLASTAATPSLSHGVQPAATVASHGHGTPLLPAHAHTPHTHTAYAHADVDAEPPQPHQLLHAHPLPQLEAVSRAAHVSFAPIPHTHTPYTPERSAHTRAPPQTQAQEPAVHLTPLPLPTLAPTLPTLTSGSARNTPALTPRNVLSARTHSSHTHTHTHMQGSQGWHDPNGSAEGTCMSAPITEASWNQHSDAQADGQLGDTQHSITMTLPPPAEPRPVHTPGSAHTHTHADTRTVPSLLALRCVALAARAGLFPQRLQAAHTEAAALSLPRLAKPELAAVLRRPLAVAALLEPRGRHARTGAQRRFVSYLQEAAAELHMLADGRTAAATVVPQSLRAEANELATAAGRAARELQRALRSADTGSDARQRASTRVSDRVSQCPGARASDRLSGRLSGRVSGRVSGPVSSRAGQEITHHRSGSGNGSGSGPSLVPPQLRPHPTSSNGDRYSYDADGYRSDARHSLSRPKLSDDAPAYTPVHLSGLSHHNTSYHSQTSRTSRSSYTTRSRSRSCSSRSSRSHTRSNSRRNAGASAGAGADTRTSGYSSGVGAQPRLRAHSTSTSSTSFASSSRSARAHTDSLSTSSAAVASHARKHKTRRTYHRPDTDNSESLSRASRASSGSPARPLVPRITPRSAHSPRSPRRAHSFSTSSRAPAFARAGGRVMDGLYSARPLPSHDSDGDGDRDGYSDQQSSNIDHSHDRAGDAQAHHREHGYEHEHAPEYEHGYEPSYSQHQHPDQDARYDEYGFDDEYPYGYQERWEEPGYAAAALDRLWQERAALSPEERAHRGQLATRLVAARRPLKSCPTRCGCPACFWSSGSLEQLITHASTATEEWLQDTHVPTFDANPYAALAGKSFEDSCVRLTGLPYPVLARWVALSLPLRVRVRLRLPPHVARLTPLSFQAQGWYYARVRLQDTVAAAVFAESGQWPPGYNCAHQLVQRLWPGRDIAELDAHCMPRPSAFHRVGPPRVAALMRGLLRRAEAGVRDLGRVRAAEIAALQPWLVRTLRLGAVLSWRALWAFVVFVAALWLVLARPLVDAMPWPVDEAYVVTPLMLIAWAVVLGDTASRAQSHYVPRIVTHFDVFALALVLLDLSPLCDAILPGVAPIPVTPPWHWPLLHRPHLLRFFLFCLRVLRVPVLVYAARRMFRKVLETQLCVRLLTRKLVRENTERIAGKSAVAGHSSVYVEGERTALHAPYALPMGHITPHDPRAIPPPEPSARLRARLVALDATEANGDSEGLVTKDVGVSDTAAHETKEVDGAKNGPVTPHARDEDEDYGEARWLDAEAVVKQVLGPDDSDDDGPGAATPHAAARSRANTRARNSDHLGPLRESGRTRMLTDAGREASDMRTSGSVLPRRASAPWLQPRSDTCAHAPSASGTNEQLHGDLDQSPSVAADSAAASPRGVVEVAAGQWAAAAGSIPDDSLQERFPEGWLDASDTDSDEDGGSSRGGAADDSSSASGHANATASATGSTPATGASVPLPPPPLPPLPPLPTAPQSQSQSPSQPQPFQGLHAAQHWPAAAAAQPGSGLYAAQHAQLPLPQPQSATVHLMPVAADTDAEVLRLSVAARALTPLAIPDSPPHSPRESSIAYTQAHAQYAAATQSSVTSALGAAHNAYTRMQPSATDAPQPPVWAEQTQHHHPYSCPYPQDYEHLHHQQHPPAALQLSVEDYMQQQQLQLQQQHLLQLQLQLQHQQQPGYAYEYGYSPEQLQHAHLRPATAHVAFTDPAAAAAADAAAVFAAYPTAYTAAPSVPVQDAYLDMYSAQASAAYPSHIQPLPQQQPQLPMGADVGVGMPIPQLVDNTHMHGSATEAHVHPHTHAQAYSHSHSFAEDVLAHSNVTHAAHTTQVSPPSGGHPHALSTASTPRDAQHGSHTAHTNSAPAHAHGDFHDHAHTHTHGDVDGDAGGAYAGLAAHAEDVDAADLSASDEDAELAWSEADYDAWWDCPLVLCGTHEEADCGNGGLWMPTESELERGGWWDWDEDEQPWRSGHTTASAGAAAQAAVAADSMGGVSHVPTQATGISRGQVTIVLDDSDDEHKDAPDGSRSPDATRPPSNPARAPALSAAARGKAARSSNKLPASAPCAPRTHSAAATSLDPVGADEAWFLVRAWAEGVQQAHEARLRDGAVRVTRQLRARAVWAFRSTVRDVDAEVDACAERLVERCVSTFAEEHIRSLNRKDGDDALHVFSRVTAVLLFFALLLLGLVGPVPLHPIGVPSGILMLHRQSEQLISGELTSAAFDASLLAFRKNAPPLLFLALDTFEEPLVYQRKRISQANPQNLKSVVLRRTPDGHVHIASSDVDEAPSIGGGGTRREDAELLRARALAHGDTGEWAALIETHRAGAPVSEPARPSLLSSLWPAGHAAVDAGQRALALGLDGNMAGLALVNASRIDRLSELSSLLLMGVLVTLLLAQALLVWWQGRFAMVSVAHEVEQALQRAAWDPLGHGHAECVAEDGSDERRWVKRAVQRLVESAQRSVGVAGASLISFRLTLPRNHDHAEELDRAFRCGERVWGLFGFVMIDGYSPMLSRMHTDSAEHVRRIVAIAGEIVAASGGDINKHTGAGLLLAFRPPLNARNARLEKLRRAVKCGIATEEAATVGSLTALLTRALDEDPGAESDDDGDLPLDAAQALLAVRTLQTGDPLGPFRAHCGDCCLCCLCGRRSCLCAGEAELGATRILNDGFQPLPLAHSPLSFLPAACLARVRRHLLYDAAGDFAAAYGYNLEYRLWRKWRRRRRAEAAAGMGLGEALAATVSRSWARAKDEEEYSLLRSAAFAMPPALCPQALSLSLLFAFRKKRTLSRLVHNRLAAASSPAHVQLVAARALLSQLRILAAATTALPFEEWCRVVEEDGKGPATLALQAGLHTGWALEGPAGTGLHEEPSYLAPAINLAARVQAATKQFGVALLLSGPARDQLPWPIARRCRLVDCVTMKGSLVPVDLYTFDVSLTALATLRAKHLYGVNIDCRGLCYRCCHALEDCSCEQPRTRTYAQTQTPAGSHADIGSEVSCHTCHTQARAPRTAQPAVQSGSSPHEPAAAPATAAAARHSSLPRRPWPSDLPLSTSSLSPRRSLSPPSSLSAPSPCLAPGRSLAVAGLLDDLRPLRAPSRALSEHSCPSAHASRASSARSRGSLAPSSIPSLIARRARSASPTRHRALLISLPVTRALRRQQRALKRHTLSPRGPQSSTRGRARHTQSLTRGEALNSSPARFVLTSVPAAPIANAPALPHAHTHAQLHSHSHAHLAAQGYTHALPDGGAMTTASMTSMTGVADMAAVGDMGSVSVAMQGALHGLHGPVAGAVVNAVESSYAHTQPQAYAQPHTYLQLHVQAPLQAQAQNQAQTLTYLQQPHWSLGYPSLATAYTPAHTQEFVQVPAELQPLTQAQVPVAWGTMQMDAHGTAVYAHTHAQAHSGTYANETTLALSSVHSGVPDADFAVGHSTLPTNHYAAVQQTMYGAKLSGAQLGEYTAATSAEAAFVAADGSVFATGADGAVFAAQSGAYAYALPAHTQPLAAVGSASSHTYAHAYPQAQVYDSMPQASGAYSLLPVVDSYAAYTAPAALPNTVYCPQPHGQAQLADDAVTGLTAAVGLPAADYQCDTPTLAQQHMPAQTHATPGSVPRASLLAVPTSTALSTRALSRGVPADNMDDTAYLQQHADAFSMSPEQYLQQYGQISSRTGSVARSTGSIPHTQAQVQVPPTDPLTQAPLGGFTSAVVTHAHSTELTGAAYAITPESGHGHELDPDLVQPLQQSASANAFVVLPVAAPISRASVHADTVRTDMSVHLLGAATSVAHARAHSAPHAPASAATHDVLPAHAPAMLSPTPTRALPPPPPAAKTGHPTPAPTQAHASVPSSLVVPAASVSRRPLPPAPTRPLPTPPSQAPAAFPALPALPPLPAPPADAHHPYPPPALPPLVPSPPPTPTSPASPRFARAPPATPSAAAVAAVAAAANASYARQLLDEDDDRPFHLQSLALRGDAHRSGLGHTNVLTPVLSRPHAPLFSQLARQQLDALAESSDSPSTPQRPSQRRAPHAHAATTQRHGPTARVQDGRRRGRHHRTQSEGQAMPHGSPRAHSPSSSPASSYASSLVSSSSMHSHTPTHTHTRTNARLGARRRSRHSSPVSVSSTPVVHPLYPQSSPSQSPLVRPPHASPGTQAHLQPFPLSLPPLSIPSSYSPPSTPMLASDVSDTQSVHTHLDDVDPLRHESRSPSSAYDSGQWDRFWAEAAVRHALPPSRNISDDALPPERRAIDSPRPTRWVLIEASHRVARLRRKRNPTPPQAPFEMLRPYEDPAVGLRRHKRPWVLVGEAVQPGTRVPVNLRALARAAWPSHAPTLAHAARDGNCSCPQCHLPVSVPLTLRSRYCLLANRRLPPNACCLCAACVEERERRARSGDLTPDVRVCVTREHAPTRRPKAYDDIISAAADAAAHKVAQATAAAAMQESVDELPAPPTGATIIASMRVQSSAGSVHANIRPRADKPAPVAITVSPATSVRARSVAPSIASADTAAAVINVPMASVDSDADANADADAANTEICADAWSVATSEMDPPYLPRLIREEEALRRRRERRELVRKLRARAGEAVEEEASGSEDSLDDADCDTESDSECEEELRRLLNTVVDSDEEDCVDTCETCGEPCESTQPCSCGANAASSAPQRTPIAVHNPARKLAFNGTQRTPSHQHGNMTELVAKVFENVASTLRKRSEGPRRASECPCATHTMSPCTAEPLWCYMTPQEQQEMQDMIALADLLQIDMPPRFVALASKGVAAYIAGHWTTARRLMEKARVMMPTDPALPIVVDLMRKYDFQAPPEWPGYRALLKK